MLLNLPVDCLVTICGFLFIRELGRLECVSKLLQTLVVNNLEIAQHDSQCDSIILEFTNLSKYPKLCKIRNIRVDITLPYERQITHAKLKEVHFYAATEKDLINTLDHISNACEVLKLDAVVEQTQSTDTYIRFKNHTLTFGIGPLSMVLQKIGVNRIHSLRLEDPIDLDDLPFLPEVTELNIEMAYFDDDTDISKTMKLLPKLTKIVIDQYDIPGIDDDRITDVVVGNCDDILLIMSRLKTRLPNIQRIKLLASEHTTTRERIEEITNAVHIVYSDRVTVKTFDLLLSVLSDVTRWNITCPILLEWRYVGRLDDIYMFQLRLPASIEAVVKIRAEIFAASQKELMIHG